MTDIHTYRQTGPKLYTTSLRRWSKIQKKTVRTHLFELNYVDVITHGKYA